MKDEIDQVKNTPAAKRFVLLAVVLAAIAGFFVVGTSGVSQKIAPAKPKCLSSRSYYAEIRSESQSPCVELLRAIPLEVILAAELKPAAEKAKTKELVEKKHRKQKPKLATAKKEETKRTSQAISRKKIEEIAQQEVQKGHSPALSMDYEVIGVERYLNELKRQEAKFLWVKDKKIAGLIELDDDNVVAQVTLLTKDKLHVLKNTYNFTRPRLLVDARSPKLRSIISDAKELAESSGEIYIVTPKALDQMIMQKIAVKLVRADLPVKSALKGHYKLKGDRVAMVIDQVEGHKPLNWIIIIP
ncbi:MAG: hypothetical protein QNL04_11010 [SAR324 cluster bacterium]|nr:hypothetical protein [SAR324 cluster bacterium]